MGQINILHNHLGYDLKGPKKIVFQGEPGDQVTAFSIINTKSNETVFSGTPGKVGKVEKWRNWTYWQADFSQVQESGIFIITCKTNKGSVQSYPFPITENPLIKNTLSDVIYYFKGQRSSGLLDKADQNMKFQGADYPPVDVHGGWYDATGDYGKHLSHLSFSTYFNPQQISLTAWALFDTFETVKERNDPNLRQYLRRLFDEAMFGADFLVRMHKKGGSFYRTISGIGPEKRPEDRRITPVMSGFKIKKTKPQETDILKENSTKSSNNVYEVGYRAGAGLSIAALARASTYKDSGAFENTQYLQVAQEAFEFLETNNQQLTNDGIENIVDDYCALMAATELYKATKDQQYKKVADQRANNLLNRQISHQKYQHYWSADGGTRPFFHAADAGLPVVSLLKYYEIANEKQQQKVLEIVKNSLASEMVVTSEVNNPFGYSRQLIQTKAKGFKSSFFYPHDAETAPWWQGENARLASMATAAKMAQPYFKNDRIFHGKLEAFATNQINWILGMNPFDSCMMQGKGRNNVRYLFFESYEYSPAPGGICNGITSGLYDEEDIDLNRGYLETGEDNDWRWAEQWLPHATWYMLSIVY